MSVRAWITFCLSLLLLLALGGVQVVGAMPQKTTETILVTNTSDSGAGSLRAALIAAAASSATTVYIDFNIPGAGLQTIHVLTPLPNVASGTVIDGLSQGTASCLSWPPTLQVALDGTSENPSTAGLYLLGNDTVQGLVIDMFLSGVTADGGNNFIQCNYLGVTAAGTTASPNGYGVRLISSNNLVGGITASRRNLISGNSQDGVLITSSASDNVVAGNYIGTQANGNNPLGNDGNGVLIDDGNNNQVGGLLDGQINLIQSNWSNGIAVTQSGTAATQGNRFYRNSLAYNSGLGLDLGAEGVTPNDPKVPDAGPNALQNYPLISSVIHVGTKHLITGSLNSLPSTPFHLEFFRNPACDPYGYGEGYAYAASLSVATDANGQANFALFSDAPISAAFTATATDSGPGDWTATSEFSACAPDVSGSLTYLPLVRR